MRRREPRRGGVLQGRCERKGDGWLRKDLLLEGGASSSDEAGAEALGLRLLGLAWVFSGARIGCLPFEVDTSASSSSEMTNAVDLGLRLVGLATLFSSSRSASLPFELDALAFSGLAVETSGELSTSVSARGLPAATRASRAALALAPSSADPGQILALSLENLKGRATPWASERWQPCVLPMQRSHFCGILKIQVQATPTLRQ